jgi:hypothetical protein
MVGCLPLLFFFWTKFFPWPMYPFLFICFPFCYWAASTRPAYWVVNDFLDLPTYTCTATERPSQPLLMSRFHLISFLFNSNMKVVQYQIKISFSKFIFHIGAIIPKIKLVNRMSLVGIHLRISLLGVYLVELSASLRAYYPQCKIAYICKT